MKYRTSRLGVLALLAVMTVVGVLPATPASAATWPRKCQFRERSFNEGRNSYIVPEGGGFLGKNPEEVCQVGKSQLIMQNDGNLVLYDENHVARWSPNTYSKAPWDAPRDRAVFQSDGNFVVYDYADRAKWASNTWSQCSGSARCVLAVQGDGNLVIYNTTPAAWQVVWATNTWH